MAATPGFTATFTGDDVRVAALPGERARAARASSSPSTTGNDVFALDENTGAIVWMHNIGSSPQDSGAGCGGIHPIGIESTPRHRRGVAHALRRGRDRDEQRSAPRGARAVRRRRHGEDRLAGRRVDGARVGRHDVHAAAAEPAQRAVAGRRDRLRRLRRPRRRLRPVPRLGHRHQRREPGDEGRLGDGRAGRGDLGGRPAWRPTATASSRRRATAPAAAARTHQDSEEVVRITGLGTRADTLLPVALDGDGRRRCRHGVRQPGLHRASRRDAVEDDRCSCRRTATSTSSTPPTWAASTGTRSTSRSPAPACRSTAPAAYRTAMGSYFVFSTTSGANMCPGGVSGRAVVALQHRRRRTRRRRRSPGARAMASATTAPIATTTDGTATRSSGSPTAARSRASTAIPEPQIVSSGNCSSVQRWTSPIAVKGRIVAGGNGHLCSWSAQ